MSQLDFTDPIPTYHEPLPDPPTPASPPESQHAPPSPTVSESYPTHRPAHDLLSILKGAFNAVMHLAPTLLPQPPAPTQTSTTTTVTTITSTPRPGSTHPPFTTLTTTTTTTTSTMTSVLPLGPSDHSNRSCVDFIRRLLGAAGATDLRINSLPVRSLCIEDGLDKLAYGQDTCAICLDGYDTDNRVRVLACDHVFHAACIDPWLRRGRPTCPLCQTVCC